MAYQEKNERINKVIQDLDLKEVTDSKVESEGERKKTNIGMELILQLLILFLDKPTTGLDRKAANDAIRLLKRLRSCTDGRNEFIFFLFNFRCSGKVFLKKQDIDPSPWGLWKNYVALVILIIIFLIIAYL
ncbi:ATP-binding cassette sub-family G member 2 [Sciurus carolinensis]|uniref:ATP-binding cassette sub-family G member 2 n=1 Tax=Sciurus carolinensis TaxID=30640 RepID=A0AA41MEP4_SCICA|nr:ATP-binding cassette sub-family G member 2 [Sciurus carolinensis]